VSLFSKNYKLNSIHIYVNKMFTQMLTGTCWGTTCKAVL